MAYNVLCDQAFSRQDTFPPTSFSLTQPSISSGTASDDLHLHAHPSPTPLSLSPARPALPATTNSTSLPWTSGAPTQPPASSEFEISPPTTPTPAGKAQGIPSASHIGIRELRDREGFHEGPGAVDGIEYPSGWIDGLEVLGKVGETIVRGINADQVSMRSDRSMRTDLPKALMHLVILRHF